MKISEQTNNIKSAYKVFYVLEVIVKHGKLSIGEISKITEYSKSTTQRIVNTLKDLKYLTQDNRSLEYYPSIKLYELGNNVINYLPIKNVSRPHLLNLYNQINETINLGILNDSNVIYLDKYVSTSPLKVELELGVKVPIYCSALGKAIAAFDENTHSFKDNYIKYTAKTISTDKRLIEELEKVRLQGYALDDEEYVEGLVCISVPVLNKEGKPYASISISKPSIRFNYENIEIYARLLKSCAKNISKELYQ